MFSFNDELIRLSTETEEEISGIFKEIDRLSFLNQKKVLEAFQNQKVSTECFNPTSGYGYDDMGREVLDRIFAEIFEAESAFVRHSILSGTHALTIALFGLLRPGDTMLAVTGTPYDTLQSVIGITGEAGNGSLADFGIHYEEIPLKDSLLDEEALRSRLKQSDVKMLYLQKSPGYSTRNPLGNDSVAAVVKTVRAITADPQVARNVAAIALSLQGDDGLPRCPHCPSQLLLADVTFTA